MMSERENFIGINHNNISTNDGPLQIPLTDLKSVQTSDIGYKIFVGNIPYQCTQEEFDACFLNVEGFIKAEIITINKTNMSRGFGFVTVKTLHDAEILKKRNDIIFKGRTLRFTPYQDETYKPIIEICTNYVFVDGIPDGKNREWLKSKFSNYEPIGRCFISMNQDTGDMRSYGIIEVLDENKYKNIISKRWHDIDGKMVETSRYKYINQNNQHNQHDKKQSRLELTSDQKTDQKTDQKYDPKSIQRSIPRSAQRSSILMRNIHQNRSKYRSRI